MDLTKRQQEIFDFIRKYSAKYGYPPTVRDIGKAVGLASSSTVHAHLANLEKIGLLRRDPSKPRALELLDRAVGSAVDNVRSVVESPGLPVVALALTLDGSTLAGAGPSGPVALRDWRTQKDHPALPGNSAARMAAVTRITLASPASASRAGGAIRSAATGGSAKARTFCSQMLVSVRLVSVPSSTSILRRSASLLFLVATSCCLVSSSMRRTYLMAWAGRSAQERAPAVDSLQPSIVS